MSYSGIEKPNLPKTCSPELLSVYSICESISCVPLFVFYLICVLIISLSNHLVQNAFSPIVSSSLITNFFIAGLGEIGMQGSREIHSESLFSMGNVQVAVTLP